MLHIYNKVFFTFNKTNNVIRKVRNEKVNSFTFLCSLLFPRELVLTTVEATSFKSTQTPLNIIDNEHNLVERTTREDIVLFHWDFESTDSLWIEDAGWDLTTSSYNN